MKRAPYEFSEDLSGSRAWRSLGELNGSPEVAESLARELPASVVEPPSAIERRSFLKGLGATLGLGGLAACRRPDEKIVPYARTPEQYVPGKPLFFATAMPFDGSAIGLVVESHEGRPTKVEGNPLHPESQGAASAYAQAAILGMYDPERSKAPREGRTEKSWDETDRFLSTLSQELVSTKGRGLAILTEPHRSPTLAARLAALQAQLPDAKIVQYAPFSDENARAGARLAFGKVVDRVADFAKARALVALDADFLGSEGSTVRAARGLAEGRNPERADKKFSRLYAIESAFTITGASADHRLPMRSGDVVRFAAAVGREVLGLVPGAFGESLARVLAAAPRLDERAEKHARAVAKDLVRQRGEGLLIAGRRQPAVVHALAYAIESALGNKGSTAHFHPAFSEAGEGPEGLQALVAAMNAGEIQTLVILGGNPVFDAPADVDFKGALAKVKTSVHLSLYVDETSSATTWHIPRAHFLEAWGDVRAIDGTSSVVQPLIAPMFGGRADVELVERLAGGDRKAYALVKETWRTYLGELNFDRNFAKVLHDGLLANSASPAAEVAIDEAAIARALEAALGAAPAPEAVEVTFAPDFHTFDGRFGTNGWLLELPEPMTKLTWANAALVSVKTARELGIEDADVVEVSLNGQKIEIPAIVAPGQVEGSIALSFGQGRPGLESKLGTNVGVLRTAAGFGFASGAVLKKTGKKRSAREFPRTQEHFLMEGRPLARRGTQEQYQQDPKFATNMLKQRPLPVLYTAELPENAHAWSMTIDLSACTGCNACVVACQAENNIPAVGPEGVSNSREMHWMRIDRYFEGTPEDPTSMVQPVLCQHCENAPCEEVCPVGATTHSPEGLNEMTYNRCIGTKYCGNNCPYKVRRYNWFNYHYQEPTILSMAQNPDVTVRARGVMEKCSFCVQRINRAKIDAKAEGRQRVLDGEVVTACQSSCPSRAITFGDRNDAGSQVARAAKGPRAYNILEELNVKPRVSYLARVDNPSPDLKEAT